MPKLKMILEAKGFKQVTKDSWVKGNIEVTREDENGKRRVRIESLMQIRIFYLPNGSNSLKKFIEESL